MIHEEICTYEVCKLAKEKGFKEEVFAYYDCEGDLVYVVSPYRGSSIIEILVDKNKQNPIGAEYTSAPTQPLLQRWLREEKGIIVEVFVDDDSNMPLTYNIHQYKDLNWECVCHHHGNYYAVNDWELCLEDALKYALKNLV